MRRGTTAALAGEPKQITSLVSRSGCNDDGDDKGPHVVEELSDDAAKTIVGELSKQREGGREVPPLDEPSGRMRYTGILIHYTLAVIE